MNPGLPAKEPDFVVAGDTLQWQRYFQNYMPANGWYLDYEIRGNAQPISFQSTPNGETHQIIVPAATTALWVPADCVMVGFACNNTGGQFAPAFQIGGIYPKGSVVTEGGVLYQANLAMVGAANNTPPNAGYWTVYNPPPQRFSIYHQDFPIYKNLEAANGAVVVKTLAQEMVEMLSGLLLQTGGDNVLESRIGDTLFKYETRAQIREEYGYWNMMRQTEIDMERAQNGKPSRRRMAPLMGITPPGPLFGTQWPFGYGGGNVG